MKRLPVIVGAVALALTSGAVAGNSIATTPLGVRTDLSELLPERRTVQHPQALQRVRPLPDHYPLETPDGTIEVSELAWHGRYRDRARYFEAVPTEEELYRYETASEWEEPRLQRSAYNTSRAAAQLDSQQPDPVQAPAIARMDAVQSANARADRVNVVRGTRADGQTKPSTRTGEVATANTASPAEVAPTAQADAPAATDLALPQTASPAAPSGLGSQSEGRNP